MQTYHYIDLRTGKRTKKHLFAANWDEAMNIVRNSPECKTGKIVEGQFTAELTGIYGSCKYCSKR